MWGKMTVKKILTAFFYRNSNGVEPVRTWLKLLGKPDKRSIGEDIRRVECNWPVGMPHVKNLNKNLWEVRSNLTDNKTARIFFTIHKQTDMVLLHGLFKKSQKTPFKDLNLANERKDNVLKGGGR